MRLSLSYTLLLAPSDLINFAQKKNSAIFLLFLLILFLSKFFYFSKIFGFFEKYIYG